MGKTTFNLDNHLQKAAQTLERKRRIGESNAGLQKLADPGGDRSLLRRLAFSVRRVRARPMPQKNADDFTLLLATLRAAAAASPGVLHGEV